MEQLQTLLACPICDSQDLQNVLQVSDNMLTKKKFTIQSCNSCGFQFTNPRPTEAVIGDFYKGEAYVSHTSTKKGLVNWLYNKVRNYTLKKKVGIVSKVAKGKTLVDVGAGTGHFLNQAKLNGFNVSGYEPDSEARKLAKELFKVDLFPIEKLDELANDSVDVITMWHVAEHLYHLKQELGLIASKLKQDGSLIIAVPNRESHDAKMYGAIWAAYDVPRHLSHFSKNDISNLAEKLGLSLKEVLPMKFDSYYVSMLSEKYKNGSNLKALWNGLQSNAKSKNGGHSSQIYILQKKTKI